MVLGGHSNAGEEGETGSEAEGNAPGNASIGSGRVNGAGAVRAKGDPVCYIVRRLGSAAEASNSRCKSSSDRATHGGQ
ncbi:hypothetical protein MKX07_004136 [Trichoderma sp. CBMAI-0711]|nr:hypothetical protein MKX07_004136 [Trichoderma sp. CBMAI-0711]